MQKYNEHALVKQSHKQVLARPLSTQAITLFLSHLLEPRSNRSVVVFNKNMTVFSTWQLACACILKHKTNSFEKGPEA